ncbi:MAG: PDZ domain-containing protein, partial [Planctomycetes bacterium]|nr:PDZ domain-containing protein [Planctomycetota bacterium]
GTPRESSFDKLGMDVRTLDKTLAKQLGLNATSGVVVAGIEQGSPAASAGISPGDLIEKVGGQSVSTVEDYEKAKGQANSDDGILLHIRSKNGRRFFAVLKTE